MLSPDDHIVKRLSGIALMFLLMGTHPAHCQVGILDSVYTFRAGRVKTGTALNIISRQTGYYFTFDSKLIDTERKNDFHFRETKLSTILDSLLSNDSLRYSVINKYIIIYKVAPQVILSQEPGQIETNYISGTITDYETGEPLPFATIGIIRKGRGTVTNASGEFGMKITRDCLNDSLNVSYLGYINRTIPVRQALGNKFNIKMRREFISIPEIIIKNQAPQEILRRAYNAINRNYGSTPASMLAFYREAVTRKNLLQIYSEAILQIYKSGYSAVFPGDQIKIIKSRKLENIGSKDTLTVRLKAGLSSCLMLDGARNTFDFLLPENYNLYDYRMTDIVTIDDESAFVIEFVQKPSIDIPLFRGSIYINTVNYAIVQSEFEINPDYILKIKDDFINLQAKGYTMWPVSIKYFVNYRKLNNRYFLNHVRGDLRFTARQKAKLFNSAFDVFFELAVTEINLQNVTRFEREELAPIYSIFSRTITNYDPSFWGNQDFLKPEDNLLQSLKNMKVKLQEFSK
jgi:hypothetical protein